jgi:hypothetical protein
MYSFSNRGVDLFAIIATSALETAGTQRKIMKTRHLKMLAGFIAAFIAPAKSCLVAI